MPAAEPLSRPGETRSGRYVVAVCDADFYREFPSQRHPVPGAGVLGAWAVPDDRKGGQNDGRRGPGQDPLGWSYLRYKAEIARLEGWADYEAWLEVARLDPAAYAGAEGLVPSDDEVAAWDEDNGCPEAPDRIGDVRALSTPRQERDRFETMQTILDDVGLRLDFTDGVDIEEGVSEINHLLDFERSADGEGFRRRPRLFFSEDCVNLMEAMENWKGATDEGGVEGFCGPGAVCGAADAAAGVPAAGAAGGGCDGAAGGGAGGGAPPRTRRSGAARGREGEDEEAVQVRAPRTRRCGGTRGNGNPCTRRCGGTRGKRERSEG